MDKDEKNALLRENRRLIQLVADLEDKIHSGRGKGGESSPKHEELVDCINSVILKITPQGIITYMNEYGLKLFGFPPEEIIGRHVLGAIVPKEESTGRNLESFVGDYFQNPVQYPYMENENILRDGRRLWMAWTNRPVYDDQGEVSGIISVGTDITSLYQIKKELEERERWLRLMTNALPVMIVYIDINRRFRYFNRAFEVWLGKDASQLQDQLVADVLGEKVYQSIKECMDRAFGGEEVRYERPSKDSKGKDIILELVYVPHRDKCGKVTGYFALGLDVTADRRARREEQKRQKLEAVIQTAGAVCHNLNQPLQSLMWETENAMEEAGENAALNESLALIQETTQKISEISGKLWRITDYRTEKYSDHATIIDLDQSSG